jgi:hypothetical protein
MITEKQVEYVFTIAGIRDWLRDRPEEEGPAGMSANEFTTAESQTGHLWLRGNVLTNYLKYRFPAVTLVASHGGIYTSEHYPLREGETIATCQEIISFDRPDYAWAELLLEMCDAVAAGTQGLTGITGAQVLDFLSIAEKIDERWISY